MSTIIAQTNSSRDEYNLVAASGADILLPGSWIQLPIDADGSDQGRLLVSDSGAIYNGVDFWKWGTPVYNYTIAVDGLTRTNGNGWVAAPTVADNSSGTLNQATISGTPFAGLNFTRVISFSDDQKIITIQDSLTNAGSTPLVRVATLDNTDPDQGRAFGPSYITQNDVVNAGSINNLVLASFSNSTYPNGLTVGFGSPSSFQTASARGFSNVNPYDVINFPFDPDGGAGDVGINLAMNYGTLDPGSSVSSVWYIVFGDSKEETIASYLAQTSDAIIGTTVDDVLTGTSDDDVILGLAGNDVISGLEGNDQIDGGTGDDQLDGGNGNDILIGGVGNDTLFVDSLSDIATENLRAGFDTVNASISWTLGSNFEKLVLAGLNAINGMGNSLNNRMIGNNANNQISGEDGNDGLSGLDGDDFVIGGNGNDRLNGNLGTDRLRGDAGQDEFFLARSPFDILLDFKVGEDILSVRAARFGLTQSPGVLDSASFVLGVNATSSNHRFIYDQATGNLFFDSDGSGSNLRVRIARLTNLPALSNTDFQVI